MIARWTTKLSLAMAATLMVAGAAGAQTLVKGDLDPAAALQPHPRMTSEFHSLLTQLRQASAKDRAGMEKSGHAERFAPIFRTKDGAGDMIQTYIWLETWSPTILSALEKAGAEIEAEDPDRFLVQAWVPIASAEQVAAVPGVRHLRRPSYAIPTLGSVTSEGDTNLSTAFLRTSASIDGTGVRLAVISAGLFNGSFSSDGPIENGANSDWRIGSGDIPSNPDDGADGATSARWGAVTVSPQSFDRHDVTAYGQSESSTPEGAAILETIFDIAPRPGTAQRRAMYFGAQTDVELVNARNAAVAGGVDVIMDNLNFYDSGRFDGTSAVSRGAQLLTLNRNITYVTSVGNYSPPTVGTAAFAATRFPLFVNGYFSPRLTPGTAKMHDFNSGRADGNREELLIVYPQANPADETLPAAVDVVLVWDDIWDDRNPRASDDLDLYIVNLSDPNISNPLASSTDIQNNSGRPIERVTYFANETSGGVGVVIHRRNNLSNAPVLFTLMILQGAVDGNRTKYLTHAVPMNNADALPPVLTVGGVDHVLNQVPTVTTVPGLDPGPGRAGARDFVQWYTGQQSPSVVSYTNTASVSASPFSGSSAGAAHIAGLMVLLRAAFPSIPAYQFYEILRDTKVPPGSFPNSTDITPAALSAYSNSPDFRRVNGLDTFINVRTQLETGKLDRSLTVPTAGTDGTVWEASSAVPGFAAPELDSTPQGLRLSPGGQNNVFGYWQTELLEFPSPTGAGEVSPKLRADRVYAVRARVGTDETDATKVPVFRLRVLTGAGDEAASLYVASMAPGSANAPTTLGGKVYTLYYRPSSAEVAATGMRFALDLIHADQPGKNADASIYLQDLTIEELALD